jgi:hypothetical protein
MTAAPAFLPLSQREPFGLQGDSSGVTHLSPGLETLSVRDPAGHEIARVHGLILKGWMGPGLTFAGDHVRCTADVGSEAALVRKLLHGLHGVFLLETRGPGARRLFSDFAGGLPLVFDRRTGRFGSSASQILSDTDYRSRLLTDRHQRLVVKPGYGWIPGPLTAHADIVRLLPGHALDLETGAIHRVWPTAADLEPGLPPDQAVEAVAEALRGFIAAAAAEHEAALALTAGAESRLMLAASRPVSTQLHYYTFDRDPRGPDQVLAIEMAAALGLRHRLLPLVEAPPEEQACWDRMVGHTVREYNRVTHPGMAAGPGTLNLNGMYGAAGKGHLYRREPDSVNSRPATPACILGSLALPADPDLEAAVGAWLDELGPLPRSIVLDLAYNELRGACWGAAQAPAQKAMRLALTPLGQAAIQGALMRTDPAARVAGRVQAALVERLWPELARWPLNRYGDWRDPLQWLRKLGNRRRVTRNARAALAAFTGGPR